MENEKSDATLVKPALSVKSVDHPPGIRIKNLLPRLLLLAAAGYLVADLALIHGPISRWVRATVAPHQEMPAARVAGFPISRSQLDRAVTERLWLTGQSPSALSSDDLSAARKAALDSLIDDALLRLQVTALKSQLAVTDAEIGSRLARLTSRFENPAALETAMKSQGIPDQAALRERLVSQIRREKFLVLRLGPSVRVTEEEALAWFGEHGKSVANPERIQARQIFIPTLNHPPEEAKQKLETALAELSEKKKDFASLAKDLSEDPGTKDKGGELGWMSRDRLPVDFAAPVFSLEINHPTLVRSRLGWHLVEVTARKPAEPRTFEQAKPEIIAALEATKRRAAVDDLRQNLRKMAAGKIEILTAS